MKEEKKKGRREEKWKETFKGENSERLWLLRINVLDIFFFVVSSSALLLYALYGDKFVESEMEEGEKLDEGITKKSMIKYNRQVYRSYEVYGTLRWFRLCGRLNWI